MDALLPEIRQVLLDDAAQRDIVTARRKHLLEILWDERFLTRTGLIARVEALLRKNCFGESAWEDTFYRDMIVVKEAFRVAGYQLAYSRKKNRPGYYLRDRDRASSILRSTIKGVVLEVDVEQIAISSKFQPMERVHQGLSISDLANQVVAYRQNKRETAHA